MTNYIDPLKHDNLRQMMERTAEHLSGRVVILRIADPLVKNATGEVYKSDDGITRINLCQGLTIQQAFNVFLHETAHAKLNHADEPMTKAQYQQSAQMDGRKINAQADRQPKEDTAEVLALHWLEWAHDQIKHLIRWNTTDEQRAIMNLTALNFYK